MTRPELPWICLVTDHTLCRQGLLGLERAVMGALDSGVNLVQLREPSLNARELFDLGSRLRRVTSEVGAALLVNDRIDVALAIGADGVQVGSRSLGVDQARRLVQDRLVGGSVHSLIESARAQELGADFLVLGTIFASGSHPGIAPAGPALIRKVKAQVRIPVIAIGGISPENAAQAIADGAAGVAVIRSILADDHPERAARRLVEQVRTAWPSAILHRGA